MFFICSTLLIRNKLITPIIFIKLEVATCIADVCPDLVFNYLIQLDLHNN
ncbi:hypothetical protein [Borreliella garinii]|nr:hypothetical protein [Borreliella garinii]